MAQREVYANTHIVGICGLAALWIVTEAIRRVHAGLRSIDPELAATAWDEADPLTDRERQVLRLAADGLTTARIGAEIHLSEGTVRNYLSEAISQARSGQPRRSRPDRAAEGLVVSFA